MPKPDINVTPLIDVLLVLLIIFMVASPLRPAKFEAKVSQAPGFAGPGGAGPLMLFVVVRPDGSFFLNDIEYGSMAELPQLTTEIQRILEDIRDIRKAGGRVYVKALKSMPYGRFVRVIDAVKMAGMVPLVLEIDGLED